MNGTVHNRRTFIGKSVAGGTALSALVSSVNARAEQQKSSDNCLRIGAMNLMAFSHWPYPWGPLMNPRKEKKENPFTHMRVTHCWDIEPDKAKEFSTMFGCEPVKNFDDMLGKVDCVISGGYFNSPWNHILHAPYIEAGIPNLIERPISNSLAKTNYIIDLARKHNTPIMIPSTHENNNETARAKAWATGKKILCYTATNNMPQYPTHGTHGLYMVCKAIAEAGNPVISVAFRGKNWYSTPAIMVFEHQNKDGETFYGTLNHMNLGWGTIHIFTREEGNNDPHQEDFILRTGTGFPFSLTEMWAPTIWVCQNMIIYREMPQTYEQIYHKTNVFLAGWKSILENKGNPVRLDEVPQEWQPPLEVPTLAEYNYTVDLFRKKFGNP